MVDKISDLELVDKCAIQLYINDQNTVYSQAKYRSFDELPHDMQEPVRRMYYTKVDEMMRILIDCGWRKVDR